MDCKLNSVGWAFYSKLNSRQETQAFAIHSKWNNVLKSLNQKLHSIITIPSIQQRLIRMGKEVEFQKILIDGISIQTKPEQVRSLQFVDEIISSVLLCCHSRLPPTLINQNELLSIAQTENSSCLMLIRLFFIPELLISLYMSRKQGEKVFSALIVLRILRLSRIESQWRNENSCMVFEFCQLLRKISHNNNSLYLTCRSTLGLLLSKMDISSWLMYGEETDRFHLITGISHIVSEIENSLGEGLVSSVESPWNSGPFFGDVCDFKAFLLPLHTVMKMSPSSDPILYVQVSDFLYLTFSKLLQKMDECLLKMQDCLSLNRTRGDFRTWCGWFYHLEILKELHKISEHYKMAEENFWMSLLLKQNSLCELLVKYCKSKHDVKWLLEHKNEYGCEFRRQLARQMIPEGNEDFQVVFEKVIGRFRNTATSSSCVQGSYHVLPNNDPFSPPCVHEDGSATLECLSTPDLMNKWFFSVCQAVFNPQNGLFMACPEDPLRLYPNPTTKLENMCLEYFSLAGRLIALSLIYKVRVGFVFDRVFFLQLAGKDISLDDIQDADPCLYRKCKDMLKMNSESIDSEALKLTFIETDEEDWPSGKSIILSNKTRKEYIDLIIQQRFITSISKQVAYFAKGLNDAFDTLNMQEFFFSCLDLEDFDSILNGIESSKSRSESEKVASFRYYSDRRRHVITKWEKGRLIGRGAYGSVYEGYAEGGFFFAVKEVQLLNHGNQAKQCVYQIEQEIALLSQFNNPNIVRYYGTSKDESKLYIFLELVSNGSLSEVYSKYHLKDCQVSAYTRQILEGLMYLHKHRIIHRDIKCANILVNVGGTVKLADFGLAKVTEFNNLIKSCKGTPCWMAPEVVNPKRRGGYGLPADIWSLGCTVLEMLTRKRPYFYLEPGQVLYRIGKGEPPLVPDSLSGLSQDFILQCLQVNPDDRPTAAQLLDHPFVECHIC
ncbi:E3 ubiquitin-protein ligase UPL5-like [Euphorbia lathyris]|uniref:E3 ubiquitin-protein ligase UPL5-like n=1 Tax=Euphorbia lathyris TaxID=212925 RepID=UPI003313C523